MMALTRATFALRRANALDPLGCPPCGRRIVETKISSRTAASTRSGAIVPEPKSIPYGLVKVFCGVVVGLFIGAAISKNIANFLEENDLFVPSSDDDDDD